MRRSIPLCTARAGTELVSTIGPFGIYRNTSLEGVFEITSGDSTNKLNLLDGIYFASLMHVCHTLSEDLNKEARVAIYTSNEGFPFSGGLNLHALRKQVTSGSTREGTQFPFPAMQLLQQHKVIRLFQDGVSSLARCRIPIICAIDSHCIGGATSLITACDFRFATQTASFTVKEAAVGMAADIGVLQRLPAIVGEGRARELAYTARVFKGAEAKQIGLVEEVFEDYPAMMAAARKAAAQIAANSPLAVQGTKHIMNWNTEKDVQQSLEYHAAWNSFTLQCDDVVESATAFAAKRKPVFKNYVVNSASTVPVPPPKE